MSTALADQERAYDDAPSAAREAALGSLGLVVLGLVGYGASLGFRLSNLHNGLLAVTFAAVGLYVLRMRPGHRVGVLFVVAGLQAAVMFFGRQYGLHDEPLPGGAWLAWLSIWQVPLGMAVAGTAIMVFPTGRFPSRRWRTAALVMVAVAVLLAVASALWPIENDWAGAPFDFPFDLAGRSTALEVGPPLLSACYQAFLLLWAAAVVSRVRRASGDEARQLRWFVSAVVVTVVTLVGGLVAFGSPVPGLLATSLVPLAAGVAVVRYRLYDIDPVINKTVVVSALALLVTAGYVAVVVGIGSLVPVSDRVLALAATAAVAVPFEPVRRRAQLLADRLVYGFRATPYETLSRLSAQLTDPDEGLLEGLAATTAAGVRAARVVVWVGTEDRLEPVAAWPSGNVPDGPRALGELYGRRELVRPVLHEVTFRGALTLRMPAGEALTVTEDRLVADLVAHAGLVIDHRARLEEVARQARELQCGLAEQAEAARSQLLEATAELREMARGVGAHPGRAGAGALEPRRSCPGAGPRRRRPSAPAGGGGDGVLPRQRGDHQRGPARRGARRRRARAYDEGVLQLAVTDDGRGGADATAGTGLQGLADRLAALGSELEVVSPPGGGTTVRTSVRCG